MVRVTWLSTNGAKFVSPQIRKDRNRAAPMPSSGRFSGGIRFRQKTRSTR